jgi:dihydroneopterin aldolase
MLRADAQVLGVELEWLQTNHEGELIDAVQGREFLLIERVAETLAEVALKNPLIDHVTISVRKRPPVQGLEWAGVQITRNRADSTSATS